MFEAQVRGVACYRDDKGEVICKGYDDSTKGQGSGCGCQRRPMGIRVTNFAELSTLLAEEDVDSQHSSWNGHKQQL
ncbi:hypothetical protein ACP70R_027915 [Stipagrostis hirtigluma subsp. patula]